MPFEHSPSPVAPAAASRLWTAGAGGGVAVLVLVVSAALHPVAARELLAGAVVAALATWWAFRSSPASSAAHAPAVVDGAAAAPSAALTGQAFEALDDPVMVVSGGEADDIAGRRVILANGAARELLRIPYDGALLVAVMRDPGVLEAIDEALFGEMARTVDYVSGGSQARHWRAWTRPLSSDETQDRPSQDRLSQDRPPRDRLALVRLRDETDARRMELMRVDFLANASHELRTPLASLSGFIETLKGHARDDSLARDRFLDIMAAQADRMSRLVADLLSLSRIELNEHIPPSGRVDLALAASDVVDAVSVLLRQKGVTVRLTSDGAAPVAGDRDEIVQVIQNLVDNAVKYSPEGGEVELMVCREQPLEGAAAARTPGLNRLPLVTPDHDAGARYAVVSVRDHGPGMARETLPRLTERFYRVEGQKSGERQGTGLGLAIVKHIVNRHRGGLVVESAPGQGALFSVWLPAAAERAPAPETDGPVL